MYSGQFEITKRLSCADSSVALHFAGSCSSPGVPNPLRAVTLPAANTAPAAPLSIVLRLGPEIGTTSPPCANARIVTRQGRPHKGFRRELLVSQRKPRRFACPSVP